MYVSVDGDMTRKTQAILVVDSCADSRACMVQELSLAGYTVAEAASPEQCLDFVDHEFPALVILDPHMPGADGFGLLTAIRERLSAAIMPIIISSADANSNTIVRFLTMGANDYVAKPVDSNVFLARVYTQIHLGQARRQITEQQERLNHVLAVQRVLGNMTSEGLVVTDDGGRIIYRN
jgi:PleD family two-component response regulator